MGAIEEINAKLFSLTKDDKDGPLQLNPIMLREDYRNKWNVVSNDFVLLCRGETPIRSTLYRIGSGLVIFNKNSAYFMLLKHQEEFYADKITMDKSKKPHLSASWCIVSPSGEEKYVCQGLLESPYLHGGVIYSVNGRFYNIETGFFYCYAHKSLNSDKYLFLDNSFDKRKEFRGIMQIEKSNGSYIIHQSGFLV